MKRRPETSRPLALLLFVSCLASFASAADLRVPEEYTDLRQAAARASVGDRILVSPRDVDGDGVFDPYQTNVALVRRGVQLLATIPGAVVLQPDSIRGSILRITTGGADAVVDGFVFEGGFGEQFEGHSYGGGIWIEDSSPTIQNCVFRSNGATFGGGIYVSGESDPLITHCVFADNRARHLGGAISIEDGASATIRTSRFVRNVVAHSLSGNFRGGAVSVIGGSRALIFGNRFLENRAERGGGAVYLEASAAAIRDNIFRANEGTLALGGHGGAIFTQRSEEGAVDIHRNRFLSNRTTPGGTSHGGAVAIQDGAASIRENVFRFNESTNGGGVSLIGRSSARILDNLFHDNVGLYSAGGVMLTGDLVLGSTARIARNVFRENGAGVMGGAIRFHIETGGLVQHNVFEGNVAGETGGAVMIDGGHPTLQSSLFHHNRADSGGAIYVFNPRAKLFLMNCTVADNQASIEGGGITADLMSEVHVHNSIVYHNAAPSGRSLALLSTTVVEITHSDIEGGAPGGMAGNVDVDPAFVNRGLGNYRLRVTSPLIDRGDNRHVEARGLDLDLTPRRKYGSNPRERQPGEPIVDMGAYELDWNAQNP